VVIAGRVLADSEEDSAAELSCEEAEESAAEELDAEPPPQALREPAQRARTDVTLRIFCHFFIINPPSNL
jgi:DNA-binding SARP family transcriptional activator